MTCVGETRQGKGMHLLTTPSIKALNGKVSLFLMLDAQFNQMRPWHLNACLSGHLSIGHFHAT